MAEYSEDYFRYQIQRNPLRKFIRKHTYLANVRRLTRGKALDFGCGVGELLQLLPAGSTGLEVNDVTIGHCRSLGLDVKKLPAGAPTEDAFAEFQGRGYGTLIISHVLEHLKTPDETLKTLFAAADKIGIARVIVIVPGAKGFASDKTHETFIDRAFFREKGLEAHGAFRLTASKYYPLNAVWFSTVFRHNELVTVFDRA